MTLVAHEIRAFGVPLREAITGFASDDLLEELEEALKPVTPPDFDQQKPWMSLLNSVTFLAQSQHLEKTKAEQRHRVIAALREHLKFWLEDGELLAFGNQVSPTPTRTPRKIQPDFWRNADIDWENEIAKDASRIFQRILIIDPNDFPGRELFPGMGPKYFAFEITEAMGELDGELPNFRTSQMSHKSRAIHVRHRVKENYPGIDTLGRGFDVDTIRRHYKRYCLSLSA